MVLLGRLGATLGRHRVLVAAAGAAAAAATATALATRTDCLSLVLDDDRAATLKKALTEAIAPKRILPSSSPSRTRIRRRCST